jgi:site-specific recombinase XerD
MRIQSEQRTRKDDVLLILDQYQREHDIVAWQRRKYAVQALSGFWGGKSLTDIDIPSCRQYTAHRMDAGVALSTIARELTVLRAACHHALRWGRIDKVPTFEVPTDLPKREIWLFKDELRILIEAADPLMRDFIHLTYGTGSRRAAIESLTWAQVNFARKTINLAKQGERKTCKRRPTVPMGDLHSLLTRRFATKQNEWVLGSDRDLFYDFQKTLEKAEILTVDERDGRPAGKITPHVLRHSRATHLLEDGASIFAVAKLLGDSVTTVQRVYGHICMSSLDDELSKSTL